MPKMKTRRAAKKRYSLTATGKVKIKKANLRHLLGKDSSKTKRPKRLTAYVHPSDMPNVKKCLPYG